MSYLIDYNRQRRRYVSMSFFLERSLLECVSLLLLSVFISAAQIELALSREIEEISSASPTNFLFIHYHWITQLHQLSIRYPISLSSLSSENTLVVLPYRLCGCIVWFCLPVCFDCCKRNTYLHNQQKIFLLWTRWCYVYRWLCFRQRVLWETLQQNCEKFLPRLLDQTCTQNVKHYSIKRLTNALQLLLGKVPVHKVQWRPIQPIAVIVTFELLKHLHVIGKQVLCVHCIYIKTTILQQLQLNEGRHGIQTIWKGHQNSWQHGVQNP